MATAPKSISIDDEIVFPNEIWIQIISHVPTAQWSSLESLNKTFQQIIHGLWWKTIENIRFDQDLAIDRRKSRNAVKVKRSLLDKLLLRAANIRAMSGFGIFVQNTNVVFPDANILQKLSEFKYLESLDFTNIPITTVELADFLEIPTIRERLKNLKLLNCLPKSAPGYLAYDDNILAYTFGHISESPPLRLERFQFGGEIRFFSFFQTMDVTNLAVLKLTESCCSDGQLIPLINRCSINLRHLECRIFWPYNYQLLLSTIASCANLSILKINQQDYFLIENVIYNDISDRIGQLSQHGHLSELSLLVPLLINDDVIVAIGNYLPNLIALELNVDQCSSVALTDLVSKMVGLKKLKLYVMSSSQQIISGDVVKAMAQTLTNPPMYPKIENGSIGLEKLKGLSLERGKMTKNDHLLVWIMNFGWKLKSLFLKGFRDGQFQGIFISLLKNTPHLRRLSLRECKIDDTCLGAIAMRCPYLEELDISLCENISIFGA